MRCSCGGRRGGGSGGGRSPAPAFHFPETHDGIRPYKVGSSHRHTPEIEQELSLAAGARIKVSFTPLGIFVALVVALSSNLADYWYIILGIGMGFFVVYQILDAIHTAKALQAGRPAPDPFGFTSAFSPGVPGEAPANAGQPRDFAKSVPTGAVVLIALGILFLLHNLGWWFLRADVLGPLVMIAIGVWLLSKRLSSPGGIAGCGARGLMGPAVLMTIGAQFLLNNLDIIAFGRTLPVLLIVIGVVLAVQRTAHHSDVYPPPPAAGSGVTEAPTPAAENPVPPSEVNNG